jgi:hypothetical protein
MKRFICSLLLTLLTVACGGSGTGSSPEASQDRSRSGQRLNTEEIETIESYSFEVRVVSNSLTEQPRLNIDDSSGNSPEKKYMISNIDSLNGLRSALPGTATVAFDDLATHSYFLVAASDCPAHSEFAGAEYQRDRVTIRVNRYKPRESVACDATFSARYHVFKAQKSQAPEVLFESVSHQSHSYINQQRFVVISDAAAWAAWWAEHHRGISPTPALPDVDFSENMVIGVYLGTRPNGCYGVGIDRIYRSGETNIVEYIERTPSEYDICTMALVSPSHLVTIPKTSYPFEFRGTVRSR